jgi:hypothetical protein
LTDLSTLTNKGKPDDLSTLTNTKLDHITPPTSTHINHPNHTSNKYQMPSKRGANWLPNEDEQLAKSWVKISEDSIQANGQKREEFWNRTAEDFNIFTPGEKRDGIALKYRLVSLLLFQYLLHIFLMFDISSSDGHLSKKRL